MKKSYFTLVLLGLLITSNSYAQTFRVVKKKVSLAAESYGLGLENFGLLNGEGAEVTDLKQIKWGEKITLAIYNLKGYTVVDEKSYIKMNITVVNTTDNQLIVAAEPLLDENIKVSDLKDDYIYGYMTMSKDFIKGKDYLVKMHVCDVATSAYVELLWTFKANFKE